MNYGQICLFDWLFWTKENVSTTCSANNKVSFMAAEEFNNNNTLPLFVHVPHFLFRHVA